MRSPGGRACSQSFTDLAVRCVALEVGYFSHCQSSKAIWPVGPWIHDWRRAGHDVGDQVARPRTDAKAMAAEARSQYQTRETRHLANDWHAIRRRIDVARPCSSDLRVPQRG